jgi:hypothetical protein
MWRFRSRSVTQKRRRYTADTVLDLLDDHIDRFVELILGDTV